MGCIGENGTVKFMAEYENDPTAADALIVVRRTIRDAARAFEKTLGPGAPHAIGIAQARAEKAKEQGKPKAASRWWEIHEYLMNRACSAAGTKTVILEAGETYDYENDRVIKPQARRPRNDRANR